MLKYLRSILFFSIFELILKFEAMEILKTIKIGNTEYSVMLCLGSAEADGRKDNIFLMLILRILDSLFIGQL